MRLVLDTNVVVSGLIWSGPPRTLLDLARRGRVVLFSSGVLGTRQVCRVPGGARGHASVPDAAVRDACNAGQADTGHSGRAGRPGRRSRGRGGVERPSGGYRNRRWRSVDAGSMAGDPNSPAGRSAAAREHKRIRATVAMIPSVVAAEVTGALRDFLATGFGPSNPALAHVIDDFLAEPESIATVLRLSNLLQFLPGAWWTTRVGVERGVYPEFAPAAESPAAPESASGLPSEDWRDAIGLAASELHALLRELSAPRAPVPEVGFELIGSRGAVFVLTALSRHPLAARDDGLGFPRQSDRSPHRRPTDPRQRRSFRQATAEPRSLVRRQARRPCISARTAR